MSDKNEKIGLEIKNDTVKRYWKEDGVWRVSIPNGIKKIAWAAFADRKSLHEIVIPPSVNYIGPLAFFNHSQSLTLVVADGSYAMKYAKDNKIKFRINNQLEH